MAEDNRIREALRAHLLHCGFVDPDDGTVPVFTGNDPHFAWTSVDKLVDALHARFDIRDRQAAPRVFFPGDTVPAGVQAMNCGGQTRRHPLRPWNDSEKTYIEVPNPEEWQAAVARARAEREADRG